MLLVKKGDVEFAVSSKGTWRDWFGWAFREDNWEPETFKILDYFATQSQENKGIYIDIGSWIGPTVLYASKLYKHVYAFEPDPVANQELLLNLEVNEDIKNVTVIDKALSDKDGTANFGGNGDLGNSQSTLLVNHQRFLDEGGEVTVIHPTDRRSPTVIVSTISFETFLAEYHIRLEEVSLLKIDIEGGEWILIPALVNYLKSSGPPFLPPIYLSIHWMFLKKDQIKELLIPIFGLYNKCYDIKNMNDKSLGNVIDIDMVLDQRFDSLVFINN